MAKIAIDLGHGVPANDTGANGYLNEEKEVRVIAPFVASKLTELGHEVKVIDIREAASVRDSLAKRCAVSNGWEADLFVSMHLNAFKAKAEAMGCEVIAMSDNSARIANNVEKAIVTLGFKSRGVKRESLYVLKHTDSASILVESFFIDSLADCNLYKAIKPQALGEAIAIAVSQSLTGNQSLTNQAPVKTAIGSFLGTPKSFLGTPKIIDILGKCDTGLARTLSVQVIAKMNRMVKAPILAEVKHPLIDTSSSSVNAYLQPRALQALVKAVESRGIRMTINSCYRTTVQQHILRQQFERGLCGLTAVAMPGKSNHEKGLAIDIEDAQGWKPYLEAEGWSWIGAFDPMHFDYWHGVNDIGRLGVSACQLLHNANNKEQLAVDGSYGAKTAAAINNFPITGW